VLRGSALTLLETGSEIVGNVSVLLQARYDNVDLLADPFAKTSGVGGDTDSRATIDVATESKVIGRDESIIRTARLDVDALAFIDRYDRRPTRDGALFDSGNTSQNGTPTFQREIFWETTVKMLGEPNPILRVAEDGTILELQNVTILGGTFNVGDNVGGDFALADIIYDTTGSAEFVGNTLGNFDGESTPNSDIWGNAGLFEIERTWDFVLLENASPYDMTVNRIDVILDGSSITGDFDPADIEIRVNDVPGGVNNPANDVSLSTIAGSEESQDSGVTFEFDVLNNWVRTTVDILNIIDDDVTPSDIYLNGFIENPIGITTVRNERGSILSDADHEVIRTSEIDLNADGGSIGYVGDDDTSGALPYGGDANAVSSTGDRTPIHVELVRWTDSADPELTPSITAGMTFEPDIEADADGDVVLDLSYFDAADGLLGGDLSQDAVIRHIRAGDDVSIVVNDMREIVDPGEVPGLTVADRGTSVDLRLVRNHFRPDENPGPAYGAILRGTNQDIDQSKIFEIDSNWYFDDLRAGDDIDVGHITTVSGFVGDEPRTYDTTSIAGSQYGASVTSVAPDTTVNLFLVLDAAWADGEVNNLTEIEQIFVTTNGNIEIEELIGDMPVGHVHSVAGDVTLRSGARIVDADGRVTVDVQGENITLRSGVPTGETPTPEVGGIGSAADFLEINVDRNDNGGKLDAYENTASGSHDGIFIDELTGNLRVGIVTTVENVGLRTVAGSIVDADDELAADVIGQTIDIDANGIGASIGEFGNDLDIDSNLLITEPDFFGDTERDAALSDTGLDDVSLEAYGSIYLSETDGALRLALAHSFVGNIRLTVRESADLDEHLYVIERGSAQFAESNVRDPGGQTDDLREFNNGTIFAESGSVTLYVGDSIAFDPNADILAANGINIFGDANYQNGMDLIADPDPDHGATMILRGRIIAGADVTPGNDGVNETGDNALGTAIPTYTAPVYKTLIFGNDDVDVIQFGDTGGIAGGTEQGDAGYIFLGSATRAYGSADAPALTGLNGKDLTTGDDGEDLFRVYFLQDTTTVTSPSILSNPNDSVPGYGPDLTDLDRENAAHTLTLDGQADTDTYEIYVIGSDGNDTRNYIVNALDTGAEDDGVDELFILSPGGEDATNDIYLLRAMQAIDGENVDRPGMVSMLHGTIGTYQDIVQYNENSPEVQRIQYDTGINGRLTIEAREGDDAFYSDDTTVITTMDGGAGDDSFQVGQIFGQNRTIEANLLPNDVFPELVATTRGWLSPGSSSPMLAQGGTGNDTFRVYSNQSELRLEGDDDNDLFIIRAFALAATVDFDWNDDDVLDVNDLDDGVALLQSLQNYQAGADGVMGTSDDLVGGPEAAIDALVIDPMFAAELKTALGITSPFDWTDGGATGGRAVVLAALEDLQDGADNILGTVDDLSTRTAINNLAVGSDGWKEDLTTWLLNTFDTNGDGGINFLDLLLTETSQDDTIVLDEDGVATPQIGLGFSVAQAPDIRAGGGQDEVRYNVNAPVSVDGGTGFDKMVILGTEFADDIVIRADGIFGAGLNVRYSTIEVVEVDGLEGDDEFFVLSTAVGVSYRVIGGLGSDVINVGGDVTEDIVTRELEGASGTVNHLVRSEGDVLYDGLVVDGFDYNVARDGEGLVVINEEANAQTPGDTVVDESANPAGTHIDYYTVSLAEALTSGQVVYVTVSAARSPQEEQDDTLQNPADEGLTDGQGESVWLSLTGPTGTFLNDYNTLNGLEADADDGFLRKIVVNGQDVWVSKNAVSIAFTSDGAGDTFKWSDEVKVYVFAPDDTRSEGDRVTVVQHSVVSNVDKYDGIDVRNVEVTVRDNDTPGVKVRELDINDITIEDGQTTVIEGDTTTQLTDVIAMSLAKPPAGGTKVVVDIVFDVDTDNAIRLVDDPDGAGPPSADDRLTVFSKEDKIIRLDGTVVVGQMTFTDANWDQEILVGIEARDDFVREDLQIAVIEFERSEGTTDPDYIFPNLRSGLQRLDVEVYDNETAGAVVLESAGDTLLVPDAADGADDYTIRLTRQPDDEVTIAVLTDGLADVTKVTLDDGTVRTITRNDYFEVGGLLAAQVFGGNIVFGVDGGQITLTRGSGSDLGSFLEEGFFGAGEVAGVVFDGALGFSTTTIAGDVYRAIDVTGLDTEFSAGDLLRIRATGAADGNNDDYTVLSVTGTRIVLEGIQGTDWVAADWTAGAAPDVKLSEFVEVEGQRIRIGGSSVALTEQVVTFGHDGTNLTIAGSGSFLDDGFLVGQVLTVLADDDNGYDANNGTYTIKAVAAGLLTLEETDSWAKAGTTIEVVELGVSNDGDYRIESISADGQTITLTAPPPAVFVEGETNVPLVLSDLAESGIFDGTVTYGVELDEFSFPGQFLDLGLTGAEEGWLADGFLEGMWVRIIDLNGVEADVDAKIQLIRGDNDDKDAKLQLINVHEGGTLVTDGLLQNSWLAGAVDANVKVVRVAVEVTFTGDPADADAWYKQQTVTLEADKNYIVPPTRDGVKIFPVSTHLLSKLRGPLAVEGGPAGADRSLVPGVKLPGETDDFLIAVGEQPPESQQIDVLNIFNDSSQADGEGTLDQTTLRGFGMARDLVFEDVSGPLFGEGSIPEGQQTTDIVVPGGISFGKVNFGSAGFGTDGAQSTIEVVNLLLGSGNDALDVAGTLDPAPFVSAQNAFDFHAPADVAASSATDLLLPDPDPEFADVYTVRSDVVDWKREGFLPGQLVTMDVDGEVFALQFRVVSVEDAVYLDGDGLPVSDGMGGLLRDPNDNSVLRLELVSGSLEDVNDLAEAFTEGDVRLVAVDPLVLANVDFTAASTATGGILTLTDGNDWADLGFLEGHLMNIGGEDGSFVLAAQYRVLSISDDGTVMEVIGEPFEDGPVTGVNVWVQGPHGGLTMVHGGGNLPVQTFGSYTHETIDDVNYLLRDDGRDWTSDRYAVGQIIHIEGEGTTREILAIIDADEVPGTATGEFDAPDDAAATWGIRSVLILSGDTPIAPADTDGDGKIDVNKSIPARVEVSVKVELLADKLTRTGGGSWLADGFDIGQVIFIEGIPGGFEIVDISETVITLGGAAIHDCVIVPGTEISVHRIDVTQAGGAQVGGDTFIIGLQAGLDGLTYDLDGEGGDPAVTLDLSDGVDADEKSVLDALGLTGLLGLKLTDPNNPTLDDVTILNDRFTVLELGVDFSDGISPEEQAIIDLFDVENSVLAGAESALVVYGDTSQDGVWYGGRPYDRLGLEFGEKPFNPFPDLPDGENEDDEWVFPLANPFDYAGDDVIDAAALFLLREAPEGPANVGFVAYGGAGNDSIIGSQAGDHLAGGSGDDTIIGQAGTDHIYGDSGVNVDIITRALYIPTVDGSPSPTVDPTLSASDQTFKPVKVASPMRDDMVAGNDVIDGNGGPLGDTENIIFGDHGEVQMWVDDPNLPPVLLQRIQTTDLALVTAILSKEPQNGGDDIIFGDEMPDLLIGGAGNDMIDGREEDDLIFGDNVELFRRADPGAAVLDPLNDITSLRFQALAGVMMYGRTDRNSEFWLGQYADMSTDPAQTAEFAYDSTGTGQIGEDNSGRLLTNGIAYDYRDPDGVEWWAEYEIEYAQYHNFGINDGIFGQGSFGNDYIAGGAGNDHIFGQLGNDWIQGDGSIVSAVENIAHVGAARVPDLSDPIIKDVVGPLTVVASFEAATDGEDYIEGGGGRDVVFGGLGQDDIVGGSSSFFSLVDPENRPDSDDWLFGGAGTQIARNNGFDPDADTDGDSSNFGENILELTDGTEFGDRHARDSDAIAGDNADIIRIVGVQGADVMDANPNDLYVRFNYDVNRQEGGEALPGEFIVVRGIRLLDYTPGGPDFAPDNYNVPGEGHLMWSETCDPNDGFWSLDIGGHDEVHGETGDDFIYLGGGFDIAFGDAEDDDIIGGWGHDWISGGVGDDGVLGDDGRIFTSRNTADSHEAETLYGILPLLANDPDTRTNQGDVLNELIRTPGNVQVELINIEGNLKKSVDLTPFALLDTWVIDLPLGQDPVLADDVIFGGLGVDWLHGGDGDDAISGAEALADSYAPRFDAQGNLVGLYKSDFSSPYNPSDILKFGDDTDPWNDPKPIQQRLGEFFLYDEYDPRRVILFDPTVTAANIEDLIWKGETYEDGQVVELGDVFDAAGAGLRHYFLNFDHTEGVSNLGFIAFKPDGQTPDPAFDPEFRQSDGDDMIFGDLGNDWLVGGTGRDRMYGGFGNDLLNADDVLGTLDPERPANNPGQLPLNTTDQSVDTHWVYEDRAFGGAGLDILIGNTKGDRLIDWVGEFNSFIVPFAPFGIATVSRQVPPHLFDFLYAQAFGDGADVTRTSDGNLPNHNDRYSNVALLQGGIRGEIGLVTQKDQGYWQDQTGGPSDPQAGNVPGGRRDVLRTSDFNNNSGDIFIRDSGNMTVQGGQLTLAAESNSGQASAVYNLDEYLPVYYEVAAQISTAKPTGGAKANAYIIFDYQSDIDFKWAGINISNNKIEMGYRDAIGYHQLVQSNKPVRIKPDTFYNVLLAVNGNNVTLIVDGVNWFTYDYTPRLDEDGVPIPLNRGFVGFATQGGVAKVDNFTVQVLPPDWTIEVTDDFTGPDSPGLWTPATGNWSRSGGDYTATLDGADAAITLADLGEKIGYGTILELEATIAKGDVGGMVFDYYDVDRYKFVLVDAANDAVLVGHVDKENGRVIDQTFSRSMNANQSVDLKLTTSGAGIGITVNGSLVGTYAFNSVLVDGQFGLVTFDQGGASFEEVTIRSNDAVFEIENALRVSVAAGPDASGDTITKAEVDALFGYAVDFLVAEQDLSAEEEASLREAVVQIEDLDGTLLGLSHDDGTISIDIDAAGHGWFVDLTPLSNEEYLADVNGVLRAHGNSVAAGRVDLLSVLTHELAHMLNHTHLPYAEDGHLMDDDLAPGVRLSIFDEEHEDEGETQGGNAVMIYDDTLGRFVTDQGLRHMSAARNLGLDLSFDPDELVVVELPPAALATPQPEPESASKKGREAAEATEARGNALVSWSEKNNLLSRLGSMFRK